MIAQFLSTVFVVLILSVLILIAWKLVIPFVMRESQRQQKLDEVEEYRKRQEKVNEVHKAKAEEELKQELGDIPFGDGEEGKP